MQIWRTTLVAGEENRDWFAMWSASKLRSPGAYELRDSNGELVTLSRKRLRPSTWVDDSLCLAFQIPSRLPPGKYQLFENGTPLRIITVVDRAAMAVPPVISNRTFGDADVVAGKDALYRNCAFRQSSVFASGGLFLDCRWEGLAYPGIGTTHSFSSWGTDGPLAIIGGVFDGCDRGPVLNLVSYKNISEPLFLGLTLKNISHVDGGNELFCVEAKRNDDGTLAFPEAMVYRPILSGWRCYNNEGDVYIGGPTEGMILQDMVMDRGSIVVYKNSLRESLICGSELRNGRIVPADGENITVERVALLDRRPTRGNRTYTEQFFYEPKLNEEKAAIYNLPEGITANGDFPNGVKVRQCHIR